jgi:hypothetical protein
MGLLYKQQKLLSVERDDRLIMNDELGSLRQDVTTVDFKVPCLQECGEWITWSQGSVPPTYYATSVTATTARRVYNSNDYFGS